MSGVRLAASGIVKLYEGVHAVEAVDLTAEAGQVAAIVGPNGAGKTTLFHCLSGYLLPDGGVVWLGDADVTRASSDARARLGLARTFQYSSVFPSLTVEENLLVGAENRRRDGIFRGLFGAPDHHARTARLVVRTVASRLGLRPWLGAAAATLPTGRLRLVELGRALCSAPSVLLLDEPASGLDDSETGELRDVLRSLAGEGLTLLLVEHDLGLVRDAADVVHVMVGGRIVMSGSPAEAEADLAARALVIETRGAAS
jgi:branched-chain amino acid transport system ATP-binding protein